MTQVTHYCGDGSIIVFDYIASLAKTKSTGECHKVHHLVRARAREVKLKPISPVKTSPVEVVRQHLNVVSAA